jgi:hypothetical protein
MTHSLKAVTLAAVIAAVSCAAITPAKAPVPLSKTQLIAVEAISRKQAELGAETNALVAEICASAGIEVKTCEIDPQTKTIRVKAVEAPPAAKK